MVTVRTFYQFIEIPSDKLSDLRETIYQKGVELEIVGSVLLSTEGCNGTVAGQPEKMQEFFQQLRHHFPELRGQDSQGSRNPFKRWKVLLKEQIVAARDPELKPSQNFVGQKTPAEWDEVLELVQSGKAQMIDVRNSYEVGIGTFRGAIDPKTATFKEFSDYLDREVGKSLDKELPTAIFCTGGIRCEKARMDLERRGFGSVLQLKGGILNYLKERPRQGFEGECFIFDERVALDQELRESQTYILCPDCGDPRAKSGLKHDCQSKETR